MPHKRSWSGWAMANETASRKQGAAFGAGTLTQPTGLKTGEHVFTTERGDDDAIACFAPQFAHYE